MARAIAPRAGAAQVEAGFSRPWLMRQQRLHRGHRSGHVLRSARPTFPALLRYAAAAAGRFVAQHRKATLATVTIDDDWARVIERRTDGDMTSRWRVPIHWRPISRWSSWTWTEYGRTAPVRPS
jgi:hypothetical protein